MVKSNQMKIIAFLFILTCSLGCSKDGVRVKYRVVSQSSSYVEYSMKGGPLTYETVSGDWSTSFRSKSGNPIYLSAAKTSPFGKLTIQVSIDGTIVNSQSTEEMYTEITIDTTVP